MTKLSSIPPQRLHSMRAPTFLLALFVSGFLAGCSTAGPRTPKDAVLVACRSASADMRAARFSEATQSLDPVITTLGGITSGDASARKARGLFRSEASKSFRGEPYERVMAFYYRGILYWMKGELDNARACFRSAQIQDADAESGSYQADYALLDYLDGWITTKLRGDGRALLARAAANARMGPLPAFNPNANVVVFFEMGRGPSKYASGEYSEMLRFRAGRSESSELVLKVGSSTSRVRPTDDLTFQATTRGGRVMDHVLANKAVFKGATDGFGDAAIISGAVLAAGAGRRTAADEVGAGLLIAGLVSKVISAATTPAADTRTWDDLPNLIGFTSLELPPGSHRIQADFLGASGYTVLSRSVDVTIATDSPEVVVFLSDRP